MAGSIRAFQGLWPGGDAVGLVGRSDTGLIGGRDRAGSRYRALAVASRPGEDRQQASGRRDGDRHGPGARRRGGIARRAGMVASNLASRSAETGSRGKARSRVSSDSGDRSGSGYLAGYMIGNLVTEQGPQAIQGLGGTPLDGADRLVEHGRHLAIAQALQIVQHEHGTVRCVEPVQARYRCRASSLAIALSSGSDGAISGLFECPSIPALRRSARWASTNFV